MKKENWYQTCRLPRGDLYLKGRDSLEGIPAPDLKKWLKKIPSRDGSRNDWLLEKGFPPQLLKTLHKKGFIRCRRLEHYPSLYLVDLTDFGYHVKNAVYCPDFKVRRSEVPLLTEKVRVALKEVNEVCHPILSHFIVFGSYINSDKEILSDLDIAVDLRPANTEVPPPTLKQQAEYLKLARRKLPRGVHLSLQEEDWEWDYITIQIN